jgi:hypothetical protein
MAKFEKMRVSLARAEATPMDGAMGESKPRRDRSEHLKAAFSDERKFLHLRNNIRFTFTPITCPSGFVGGVFKRERPEILRNENLEPYKAENYEIAIVVLSIDKDQISWVEVNQKLGSSKSLLESFLNYLLTKTDINDWRPYVEYFDNSDDYWKVIKERKSEIASVKFTFVPPNPLGASDLVYKVVKDISLEAHPEVQQHVYRAKPGAMDLDTPMMRASAEIAMKGGGDAEIHDEKRHILYSSSGSRVIDTVDDDELPTPAQPAFMVRLIDRLFKR